MFLREKLHIFSEVKKLHVPEIQVKHAPVVKVTYFPEVKAKHALQAKVTHVPEVKITRL